MDKQKHGKNNVLFILSELRRFLRVETAMVITFMALSGYLIFNRPGPDAAFLAAAMFFAGCASYAYNHYTDKKEDAANDRRLNMFVLDNRGYFIIIFCTALSLASSAFLSLLSVAVYLAALSASFAYSGFRIKKIPVVKNIYSGFFLSMSFLAGAAMGGRFLAGMVPYVILLFLVSFSSNLMGDIRGFSGDRLQGLKTIPVVLGIGMSKGIVHLSIGLFAAIAVMSGCFAFMAMIPALAVALLFLDMNDHKRARSGMITALFVLLPALAILKITEVCECAA
jgi:4-hydroxybenzoate polyprenyltransferase